MKVVFFGASKYVLPIIEFLNTQHELALVVTTEQSPHDAVPSYCKKNSIPFISVTSLKDEKILSQLRAIHAPVAVLAYFRLIVHQEVIDVFPKGIVNIHPSLLPKYRGTTPGTTAILNGDMISGVSIILLDKDVDHGPMLAQESGDILPSDTAETFYKRFFTKGTQVLKTTLQDYVNGKLQPVPQDHTKATFTKQLTKQSGFIDSEKSIDKKNLYRMIRAYYPWPGVWTTLRIKNQESRIKFLPSVISHKKTNDPFLIQVEGKKPVSIKDFLNGYPEAKEWLKKF